MKILKNSTYDALVQRAEDAEFRENQMKVRLKDARNLRHEESLTAKFNFGAKIQRAVIGANGTGKTTFLKHIAKKMPYRCQAFNFGQMDEFSVEEDKVQLRCIVSPTIHDVVNACCLPFNLPFIHLIDNCAMHGIDEARLVRELHKRGAQFIITSQSIRRLAGVQECLDFMYRYPTRDNERWMYPYVCLDSRTLRPVQLEDEA